VPDAFSPLLSVPIASFAALATASVSVKRLFWVVCSASISSKRLRIVPEAGLVEFPIVSSTVLTLVPREAILVSLVPTLVTNWLKSAWMSEVLLICFQVPPEASPLASTV
jgi:hypothetical protein